MEHSIESGTYRLVGIQKVIKLSERNIDLVLGEMRSWLAAKIEQSKGLPRNGKEFGYWQVIDGDTRVFFMGIPVEQYEGLQEDFDSGFLFWELGKRRFAAFDQAEPGPSVAFYDHLPKNTRFDRIFIGDFQVYDYTLKDGTLAVKNRQIWIPLVP